MLNIFYFCIYIFSKRNIEGIFALISRLPFSVLLNSYPPVLLIGKYFNCRRRDTVKQGSFQKDLSRGLRGFSVHWAMMNVSYYYYYP